MTLMLNEWTAWYWRMCRTEERGKRGEMKREQDHSSQGKRVSEGGGGLQLGGRLLKSWVKNKWKSSTGFIEFSTIGSWAESVEQWERTRRDGIEEWIGSEENELMNTAISFKNFSFDYMKTLWSYDIQKELFLFLFSKWERLNHISILI